MDWTRQVAHRFAETRTLRFVGTAVDTGAVIIENVVSKRDVERTIVIKHFNSSFMHNGHLVVGLLAEFLLDTLKDP